MATFAFDTHKAVTALKQAGFEEGQAEAVVTTMGKAMGGNIATKTERTWKLCGPTWPSNLSPFTNSCG